MKKNAFTLVELLAVIVILAVILVIAVPKIADARKNAQKEYESRNMLGTLDQVNDPILCSDISKTSESDYSKCKIRIDNNIAKVDLVGNGKFEGLSICDATKDEAELSNGHTRCDLPSTYQEVEYIESTGTQYIDTEYIPTGTPFKIEASIQWNSINQRQLMGHNTSASNYFGVTESGLYETGTLTGVGSASTTTFDNVSHGFPNNASVYLRVNGNEISRLNTFYTTSSYYIFALNYNDSPTTQCKCKIKYFKIYDNDVLKRDMVPCYVKSSGGNRFI